MRRCIILEGGARGIWSLRGKEREGGGGVGAVRERKWGRGRTGGGVWRRRGLGGLRGEGGRDVEEGRVWGGVLVAYGTGHRMPL